MTQHGTGSREGVRRQEAVAGSTFQVYGPGKPDSCAQSGREIHYFRKLASVGHQSPPKIRDVVSSTMNFWLYTTTLIDYGILDMGFWTYVQP